MANGLIDFASFNPVGAFAGGLESGSKLVGGVQDSIARREEQERLERARALLGQSVDSELAGLSPEMFAAEQQFKANQAVADQAEQQRMLESVARDAKTALDIKDPAQRNQFLQRRVESVFNAGGDPSDTIELMKLPFEQQNFELQDALNQVASVKSLSTGSQGKFIGTPQRVSEDGQNFLVGVVQKPDGTFAEKRIPITGEFVSTLGETAEEKVQNAIAAAGGKAAATVEAQAEAGKKVANIVAETKSSIVKAVKLAEADAKSRGESLGALGKAKASMPGLLSVTSQLKELAPLATSTMGGRLFDAGVKELGFGSTKGATAKAKFGALINNQILPLLKQTFGAAFTAQEGAELKKTMGDVDASPEEKIAQLDAFIDGKVREIQTLERELGGDVTPTSDILDLTELSDEELEAQIRAAEGGQ